MEESGIYQITFRPEKLAKEFKMDKAADREVSESRKNKTMSSTYSVFFSSRLSDLNTPHPWRGAPGVKLIGQRAQET